MVKFRIFGLITTFMVLLTLGTVAIYYARGYRFDGFKIKQNGILVVNSVPIGAQVHVNGELKSASNTTLSLPPATYDLKIQKEGYFSWQKRIAIEKEIVTVIDASLFPTAISLSALTAEGVINPVQSPDLTKIVYSTPKKDGLWLIEILDLPLGFSREPRQITDADFSQSSWQFSPDSKDILVTTKSAIYQIDTGKFTSQTQLTNLSSQKKKILEEWEKRKSKHNLELLSRLPDEFKNLFEHKATNLVFSPDETKVLYTASESASFSDNLVKHYPGASTQKQDRTIKIGNKYIYDIREDRNFAISETSDPIFWLTNSRNLMIVEKDKISITDYDATNRVNIFSGSFIYPFAYASPNSNRIIVLTSLGSTSDSPNLYSLSLK